MTYVYQTNTTDNDTGLTKEKSFTDSDKFVNYCSYMSLFGVVVYSISTFDGEEYVTLYGGIW